MGEEGVSGAGPREPPPAPSGAGPAPREPDPARGTGPDAAAGPACAAGDGAGAGSAALTVYFDGACPVCSREIGVYRRMAGGDAIAWVDASSCAPASLGSGLARDQALARMHVRQADGSLVSGAAAFAALWRSVPGLAWLGRIAASRPVLPLLEASYSVFLRLRRWRQRPPPEA